MQPTQHTCQAQHCTCGLQPPQHNNTTVQPTVTRIDHIHQGASPHSRAPGYPSTPPSTDRAAVAASISLAVQPPWLLPVQPGQAQRVCPVRRRPISRTCSAALLTRSTSLHSPKPDTPHRQGNGGRCLLHRRVRVWCCASAAKRTAQG